MGFFQRGYPKYCDVYFSPLICLHNARQNHGEGIFCGLIVLFIHSQFSETIWFMV